MSGEKENILEKINEVSERLNFIEDIYINFDGDEEMVGSFLEELNQLKEEIINIKEEK